MAAGSLMTSAKAAGFKSVTSFGHEPQLLSLKSARLGPIMEIQGLGRAWRKADLGYLSVPMNWSLPGADRVLLRFARFNGPVGNRAAPVIWFSGGPTRTNDLFNFIEGPATLAAATRALGIIDVVTAHRDMILIDHRGAAGCASPKLTPLGILPHLPLDRPVGAEERLAQYRKTGQRIIDSWAETGVNLAHFSTPALARDVDAVRAALGYDRIVVAGGSNGTYRIREMLRQFGTRIEQAVLFIAHGYEKMPDPLHVDKALQRIFQAMANDDGIGSIIGSPVEMIADIATALGRTNPRVKVKSPLDGADKDICLGPEDLVPYFWETFGNDATLLDAPRLFKRLAGGDYGGLAASAIFMRQCGDTILDPSAYELAFAGTSLPADFAERRSAAKDRPYLNRELHDGLPCGWPIARDAKTTFHSNVPTVFVQGEWDIRTPIEGVQNVLTSKPTLLTVPYSGHHNDLKTMIAPIMTAAMTGKPFPSVSLRAKPAFSKLDG
jgi:pimeloyl-ACP methyl ester carboxylesterase